MSRSIGAWFIWKYVNLAINVGTQQAARNMRKQGIPLHVALAILSRGV